MNMAKDRLHGRKTLAVTDFLDEFEKDDIRKDVNIVSLFQHFGVSLTKRGKSWMGKCPWHDDSTPSLSVDHDKGLYNCFGCGESGDIFTLTGKMKNLTFRESVEYLKDFTGTSIVKPADMNNLPNKKTPHLNLAASRPDDGEVNCIDQKNRDSSTGENIRRDAEPSTADAKEEAEDEKITPAAAGMSITAVSGYYHKRLFESSEALSYLKSRGLANTEILNRFNVGFADGSIMEKLSDAQKDSLKQQGIITDKGREHFKDCITVPIFDDAPAGQSAGMNNVVGIYGRSINPKTSVNHLYLKGKHRGVFNRKASKVYDEIILAESIIDAMSLISLGFENTQSIYGINGFTGEHLNILKDDRVKNVVLAFDSDEPGRNASLKLKEQLIFEGFAVKVVIPPDVPNMFPEHPDSKSKDWNEFLVTGCSLTPRTDLSKSIAETIKTAEIFIGKKEDRYFNVSKDHIGYIFTINGIEYRVTGAKEIFISNLRVNIKAQIPPAPFVKGGEADCDGLKYYDNLDLYSARSRSSYAGNMGKCFDIEPKRIEKDLITILEHLESERDRHLLTGSCIEKEVQLTQEKRELGLSFLKSHDMFTEIARDMDRLGYVGEELNKQLMYIAATSRKLDDPISVMVISESASGKSLLIDTVARLIPPDEVISVTSLSEQALNYMEDLSHKFVSLGEIVHSETIEHQIREMLSKKELSRLVTTKEGQSGRMVTKKVKIPAIVSLAMSGTRYDMNPENTSRCFVVNTDESREQTRRIHEEQRNRKYSLERDHEKKYLIPEIIRKHHAAQKLLKALTIVNPFGRYLDFPDSLMRTRRDNDRFIDLIACVCFLRQYQKEAMLDADVEYIECDIYDYEIAYRIMVSGVLSSSLLEIPRGAVELYDALRKLARDMSKKENIEPHEVSFTQREIREATGYGQTWLKIQLKQLVDYEYVLVARGGRARSKGYYRIRTDEEIESVNVSMIPTPEEINRKVKGI